MNIAILGCGVVGSGVARLILKSRERLFERFGVAVELKWILDRKSLSGTPLFSFQAHSFDTIVRDPDCDIVVEALGGTTAAYDYTKQALMAGKHVISSNKELVSTFGPELLNLAREHNCYYLYEAAVGGGIPLLRSLREDLAANEITQMVGILNGTSNFILQEMEEGELDFYEALAEAQQLGYAEQDPSADIGGKDTARKLAILCSRLFGTYLDPDRISVSGIEKISLAEIDFARRHKAKIKLLALMQKTAEEEVSVVTAAYLIPRHHPLFMVNGVYNALMVEGSEVGDCLYYGQGAGSEPTASSVLSDIIQVAIVPFRHGAAETWVEGAEGFYQPAAEQTLQAFLFPKTKKAIEALAGPAILAALKAVSSPSSESTVVRIGFTGKLTEKELYSVLTEAGITDEINLLRYMAKWDVG